MEKIHGVFRELVNTHLERAIVDKLDEMVDEINTCYSILLKVQDWIVKHEKHSPKG